MPGLVPGIHVLERCGREDVAGRDKPDHDDAADAVRQLAMNSSERFDFTSGAAAVLQVWTEQVGRTGRPEPQ